jgi:hypothetical protein
MTKPDEPGTGKETSAFSLDWSRSKRNSPATQVLFARTDNMRREKPAANGAGTRYRPVLDRPPSDLFELGLEAECHAGMARSRTVGPDRGKPVHDLQFELERAPIGDTPYENYPNSISEVARARRSGFVGAVAADLEIPTGADGETASRRLPAAPRLSGRYQLMLGLLAGMIAAGGVAFQWASDPAGTRDRGSAASEGAFRSWALQGPIVVDIPGKADWESGLSDRLDP